MIKINLGKRRKSQPASIAAEATRGKIFGLDINIEEFKELPILKIVLVIVLIYFANDFFVSEQQKAMNIRLKELTDINTKVNVAKKEVSKIKEFEAQKKELEKDEENLKNKIQTIQTLLSNRNDLYNTLLSLTTSIPTEVWLTGFELKESVINVRGGSIDINLVSDFIKKLSSTPYFKNVNLKKTDQTKDSSGLDTATFELSAVRR